MFHKWCMPREETPKVLVVTFVVACTCALHHTDVVSVLLLSLAHLCHGSSAISVLAST